MALMALKGGRQPRPVPTEEEMFRQTLRRCVVAGDADSVLRLLNDVPDPVAWVNTPIESDGATGLHMAARLGHLQMTQELIMLRAEVEKQDLENMTPLHLATMEEHADVVLELLCAHANPNVADSFGQTTLHKVCRTGSKQTLKVLLDGGADPSISDDTLSLPLLVAAKHGRVEVLQELLDTEGVKWKAPDPKQVCARNESGWTALHLAAHGCEKRCSYAMRSKFAATVRALIAANAPIDGEAAMDEDRKTPLHRAAQTGNKETVAELLKAGADVTVEDNCRWTPLHFAAQDGHLETARLLLDHKAIVQVPNPSCLSPLAVAVMENQVKMVELLMKNKADPNHRGKGLASPLMIARKDPKKYNEILGLFELGFIRHEEDPTVYEVLAERNREPWPWKSPPTPPCGV
eukprot:gnl/TRDRNA2_/TRDRNA2_180504_c0_seq1.p1 gnl/TRDRNA2_/TRDRNA2_180504_c0~~gnl/TRDRNA2_/TRDRNA2_180504_c0_seq1.p1  ORF type:complete len:406 (-),score=92.22 gnl/TRDRNA2_/TRDRNA2_180504_c0_seq1:67-1284(-)